MVDIELGDVDLFLRELDAAQRAFNSDVSAKFREWVRVIFYDIVELTPQWSGNLAANWFISASTSEGVEETIPAKSYYWPKPSYVEPHKRGDAEAVSISKARFDEFDFGYSTQVYIFNPAEIAPQVEAQTIKLRGVNLLDGRVAMIAHAQAFYSIYSPQL